MGTGQDVECLLKVEEEEEEEEEEEDGNTKKENESLVATPCLAEWLWEGAVLVSPFFFWGTAMVAMKEVFPKCGPFFVVVLSHSRWVSFLLASLLSMPLAFRVAEHFSWFGQSLIFGESIGIVGAVGLVLGVIGLVLLELPALPFDESNFSLWGSGEWWTLLAAQGMAVGTVMVRWASKYSDLWSITSFKEQSAHCHGSVGKELSKLVAFVKGTQFDLVEYVQRERYGSARVENFASGLELISQKV